MLTYADFTSSLALIPGKGGQFEVEVNGDLVYSKKAEGNEFPAHDEVLKRLNAR